MVASAINLGGPTRVARDGESGTRLAIIPQPAYPSPSRSIDRRLDAISATYTGSLEAAVDLYRGTVGEDGFFDGILKTMAHGLLGLPISFQGDPEMCAALLDARGTPGDYKRMHPREECAKIVEDGIGFGLGLGQYVQMCWRCAYTDLDLCDGDAWCKRCHAPISARPLGQRRLYQLQWRDIRWLSQIPHTSQLRYAHRGGLTNIVDGDGEWLVYRTVPGQEPWRHGPWIWATLAAIFSRDASFDAQNTSSVCAPTPVLRAIKPTTEPARREANKQIADLMFENKLVLSGEWIYEVVSASADYIEICEKIVARSSDAFETGITGNVMGRAARAAFTDADVYARVTASRRAFYCGTWTEQTGEKGLVWWGLDNYGTRNVPVGSYDVRSPEDKLAECKALSEAGAAIKAASDGYGAVGYELDPSWIEEDAQRRGIRVRKKAGNAAASKLPLGVDAVGAVVRGGAALDALGLPPFGDERDDMTIAELSAVASEVESAVNTTHRSAPGDARAASDDEMQPDDAAARLAEKMTEHRIERCEHGSSNRCRMCGIERLRDFERDPSGQAQWRVAWRAIVSVLT